MRYVHDIRKIRRIANRALASGATMSSLTSVKWDCSNGCENPQLVTLEGREVPLIKNDRYVDGHFLDLTRTMSFDDSYEDMRNPLSSKPLPCGSVMWIDIFVPCRKCEHCLARRAYMWRMRALREISIASRTWMGTLTIRPYDHIKFEYMACVRLKKSGFDFYKLNLVEQCRERHFHISQEITKYFKRLRKASQYFRYLLVLEAHKTGLPHYHLLMHEPEGTAGCRKSVLQEQWTCGFSCFKLVEGPAAAGYVTKYLVKSCLARQRASLRYGSCTEGLLPAVAVKSDIGQSLVDCPW